MKKTEKNKEELLSRRQFFRQVASKALPIMALTAIPSLLKSCVIDDPVYIEDFCSGCTGKCTNSCQGLCVGGCYGSCSGSCSSGCQGACKGTCKGTCYTACRLGAKR